MEPNLLCLSTSRHNVEGKPGNAVTNCLSSRRQRINDRPAVKRGCAVPSESQIVNKRYQERLEEEPDFKKKEEELAEIGKKAKEQYGYKYSSP
ncbi:hypothetical protein LTR08_005054 [Meristemomyces frigidus]|nr:hypothetical protein LTR08_005054 [Meristemomyces frigidus]